MLRLFLSFLFVGSLFSKQYDVIVIGAGISGIAAANKLHEAGLSVAVLEARDYIGGRTHTTALPKHPLIYVDWGAAWIHGTKNNPLMPLIQKYGVATKKFNYDLIHRYDTTPPLQPPPLSPLDNGVFDSLYDQIASQIRKKQKEGKEMSLQEALDPWIKTFSEKEQAYITYMLTSEIEHDYGCDCNDLSLLHFDDDDEFKGPDDLMIEGYQPLINGLAENLVKDGCIFLKQPIDTIRYDASQVIVESNGEVFSATDVICTVPLGVLKAKTLNFDPPLPSDKLEAIDRLHMGILDKAILLFPYQFWEDQETLIGRIPPEKGLWVETVNYAPFNAQPLLVAFNAGQEAKELIEDQTDEHVIASVMAVLRSIYGNEIPDPIDYLNLRWGLDPYSYGSYAHLPPGATMDDFETLAKPVGHLRFAGEATTSYPGTTHGAYLSGIREAERILKPSL